MEAQLLGYYSKEPGAIIATVATSCAVQSGYACQVPLYPRAAAEITKKRVVEFFAKTQ